MKFADLATSPYFKDVSDTNFANKRNAPTYRDDGVTMFLINRDSFDKGETIEWEGQEVTSLHKRGEGFNIELMCGTGRHFRNMDDEVTLLVVRRIVEIVESL